LVPDDSYVPIGHPWVFDAFPNVDGPCVVASWRHRVLDRPGILEVTYDGWSGNGPQIRRRLDFVGPGGTGQDAARLMNLWVDDGANPPASKWPRRPIGRPKGATKGRQWSRREILQWHKEAC